VRAGSASGGPDRLRAASIAPTGPIDDPNYHEDPSRYAEIRGSVRPSRPIFLKPIYIIALIAAVWPDRHRSIIPDALFRVVMWNRRLVGQQQPYASQSRNALLGIGIIVAEPLKLASRHHRAKRHGVVSWPWLYAGPRHTLAATDGVRFDGS